jgi:nucleoside-diphosphate-sugar epimerase
MRIAILGATSQIAKDLILSFSEDSNYELILYARQPDVMTNWLCEVNLDEKYFTYDYSSFYLDKYFDAIINFVGVGDPAKVVEMGVSIFDATLKYDELALEYVKQHPNCRYIFLSSGVAYHSNFDEPADKHTKAMVAINDLQPQHWYGVAKLYAECRHRAFSHLPIVDVRIFNYFSHTSDITARFLITDMIRAIKTGDVLITSSENIIRDFIGPDDFFQLVSLILEAPVVNDVIDCYTKAPVDKMTMLEVLNKELGLLYEVREVSVGVNATGEKINYFSKNNRAALYGYKPSMGSLETIIYEAKKAINAD